MLLAASVCGRRNHSLCLLSSSVSSIVSREKKKAARYYSSVSPVSRRMLKDPLVWIDLEMTGLDLHKDRIIEIAVILTDGSLKTLIEGPDIVIAQSKDVMDSMNAWCIEHHAKSGLTAAVLTSTTTVAEAEAQVLQFVKTHIPDKRVGVMAGNSIHVDKEFLRKEMPSLLDHLHYRLVDVSTLKELAWRWDQSVIHKAPSKDSAHRALSDIRSSIDELKYYRKAMMKI